MSKNKLNSYFPAAVDDVNAAPFSDIQKRLDDIQDSGMTALAIRNILFHKMLDLHAVPQDHYLRNESTPDRLDDPSLINKLNELGFYRTSRRVMH
ncbi:hypothetical protein [Pseudoalteromonas luteoviolacea]|uniref:Uncharacterized protein n=1 Tax=Pseudoalteromonas luteoviolacea DSM 6061 TaxID=1365250 RepID=A0A166WRK5_9GAMM|nr:hypothetical protein [Pseudoalteromonas luteoviolacea]KZN37795.1 hypothetical protein N475_02965 [Pseudoalteromonas luteoviolacea DSM 6061]KZN60614.1 hypothetical protein N474_00100 [Pseudoalteromonas luteoviolacea CPMOR-2]MBE0386780.1 hypothetical protein [Pseudoalteromonas luteoviolacea DSM 6061]TQF71610.1 hypothetical protein FLM44_11225 [Pseudoalteromonas luteoviolacea]